MNNIKIIYDTMNDLPENMKEKYDIDMLPATIIFQGKEYKILGCGEVRSLERIA